MILKKHLRPCYIYKLYDPITQVIYYIGKTINDPILRYKVHISGARGWKGRLNDKINEYLRKGKELRIGIIEYTHIPTREYYWINYYSNIGQPLCNTINTYKSLIPACAILKDFTKKSNYMKQKGNRKS